MNAEIRDVYRNLCPPLNPAEQWAGWWKFIFADGSEVRLDFVKNFLTPATDEQKQSIRAEITRIEQFERAWASKSPRPFEPEQPLDSLQGALPWKYRNEGL